ncbi:MAG: Asp/Glu racemase [Paracoccaceae bacterium]|nr:Asp/Glu racemase [Paracoccaceae bacterium]MDG2257446.1 Asp/Glu racemase [Paracoccaceae bacterium]
MSNIPYTLIPDVDLPAPLGLIALQTDETLEPDFKRSFADHPSPIYVSRIPSGAEVTTESLSGMEDHITASADLLPKTLYYPVVGYGCTSASSIIGSERVEQLVQKSCNAGAVTNPLRAAIAFAHHKGISKLALLSPYIEEVNVPLRSAFQAAGLSTDVFGTFGEAQEAKVARITNDSVVAAAISLGSDNSVEGVFLSCTNLKTLDAIPIIQKMINKPVFSSNYALAWHMKRLIGQ